MRPAERRRSDVILLQRFLELPWTAEADTLLLFYGVGAEPDTGHLLLELGRQGKRVLLPKCLPGRAMEARLVRSGDDLRPGAFGIPEPLDTCPTVDRGEIDLILVPALCYDLSCRRLGQEADTTTAIWPVTAAGQWACAGRDSFKGSCPWRTTTGPWIWC